MKNTSLYLYLIIFCFSFQYTSAQQKITVNLNQPKLAQIPEMYLVTVKNNRNMIYWASQPNSCVSFYNIYRKTLNASPDGYKSIEMAKIGQVTDSKFNSFTDVFISPDNRFYSYLVSAVDNCGNELQSNESQNAIYLDVKSDNQNSDTLRWNGYKSKSIVGYNIFQGNNLTNLSFLSSVTLNDTMFINNKISNELMYYQIEASILSQYLDPFNEKIRILSNVSARFIDNLYTYYNPNLIHVFIDRNNGNLNIDISMFGKDKNMINVYDTFGKLLYSRNSKIEYLKIPIQELAKGLNIIRIVRDNYSVSKKIYL